MRRTEVGQVGDAGARSAVDAALQAAPPLLGALEPQAEHYLAPAAVAALAYPAPGSWMPPLPPGAARLSAGYPFPEAIPVKEILASVGALLAAEADAPLHYLGSQAMVLLPRLLAGRMAQRGMPAEPEEILVTSGACQGIDLAARVLLGPGDVVAVEAPTYMEALEIFRNYTPAIVAYPVDSQGLDVAALARDLHRRRAGGLPLPKVLYTVANFQNPTGATLTLERRRRLLALAEEYDFLILEDDAYGELAFGPAEAPLKVLDRAGRVVHLGSLSKIVAPGLRIGWMAGPAWLLRAVAVFKKDLDHPFAWALTARFLESTDLDGRLSRLRRCYHQRRDWLLAALAAHMPAGVTWSRPEGGFFVWVTLPAGMDAAALLPAALKAGVAYVPGRYFFLDPEAGKRHLRLSFSYLPREEMERGVAALARALGEYPR